MKQQFLKAKTDTIRMTVYVDNRAVQPSSAKVTLYHPSGSSLQVQANGTVDGTTYECTYDLTTTHTATADLNYKAIWEYVVSGSTYYHTQLFDVVKSILAIPITDIDLYDELDSLRQIAQQITGTATAGAAGTLTDTGALKSYIDDYFTGGRIAIESGTGSEQERDVTDFVQSTGVVSITPNWTTNPSTDSIYRIVKPFTDKISQCFEKLETMIYNKGKRHSLILESSQIKYPLIYLVLHFICLDSMNQESDKWALLAASYWDKFQNAFDSMVMEYDEDESGAIVGEDEEQANISEFTFGRS